MRKKSVAIRGFRLPKLTIWLIFLTFAWAQTPERIFLRKSISYYDGILLPQNITLPSSAIDLIKAKLKQALFLARFDYNHLPQSLQNKANEAIAQLNSPTIEQLGKALEDIFVPEIVKILSINKELRAKEFVDQQERINFLTTKAKESGITADDLEKVMNAAYLFIPFITSYSSASGGVEGNRITINIEGGIIWYHISTLFDQPRLVLLVKKSSNAFGTAIIGKKYYEFILGGEELNAEEFALLSAVKAYVKNLQTMTREIPEFRLSAEIVSVSGGQIVFKLGTKEGLKIDDKFDIVEFFEDTSGVPIAKSIGCALVTKVANNKDTLKTIRYSEARTFLGRAEPGMLVLERPRLPIEIGLRFGSFPLERSSIFGGSLGLDFNVSNLFKFPHFYIPLEFGFGFPENYESYYEIGLGLVKKFYFPRFNFGPKVLGKITGIGNPKMSGIGIELTLLTEFYLTPDIAFGAKGGYAFGRISERIKTEGLIWSVGFTYNPPTLPFDPFSFLRGYAGL
uniref:Uncharacterized protein n=1 Tax=candidate division WOR-3 bacterium TaxID=2052148 RepID=A0A7C6EAS7_UNCW3